VVVSMVLAHSAESNFPNPDAFDPTVRRQPADTVALGGLGGWCAPVCGRCVRQHGDAVTLRTLLRRFEFATTDAAGESHHSRGIANAPGRGGRAVVHRRPARASTQLRCCQSDICYTI